MGNARRLAWEGCRNVRHVGGVPLGGGATASPASLVRSDDLAGLTCAGRARAIEDGVRTIVDLRFPEERAARASPFGGTDGVGVRHVPLLRTDDAEALAAVRAASTIEAAYLATLHGFGSNLVAALEAVASAPPGRVVVHCSGGVDRTGLTFALLLRLAGAPMEAIASDYAVPPDPAGETAPPDAGAIARVLALVEARDGSVGAALARHGAAPDMAARLTRRLTGAS